MMKAFFFLTLFALAVSYASCSEGSNGAVQTSNAVSRPETEIVQGVKQLPNQQVCMVNDRFMNKSQIPVAADQRTYYGCCQGCVDALKKDATYRMAADPQTGQQVDKASAVIIRKPGTEDEVLYFSSIETARKFIMAHSGKLSASKP